MLVEQHDALRKTRAAVCVKPLRDTRVGLLDHRGLQLAAFLVDRGKASRTLLRSRVVVREQTLDPDRHVLQPASRVDARAEGISEIGRDRRARVAPRRFQQRAHAGAGLARADAPKPRLDEHAIVAIQPHEIGDRADRDEIEQRAEIGSRVTRSGRMQLRTQREQQIEHDADAGQRLARETVARQVRIHDGVRVRQSLARKMMIGHDHAHAAFAGTLHPGHAGHAVVDGEHDVRIVDRVHQRGRQPVAVHGTVRNPEAHVACAEHAKAADRDRSPGRAVRIEITDHDDAGIPFDRVGQQRARRIQSAQGGRRQQRGEAVVDLLRATDSARRIDALQHRMQIGAPPDGVRIHLAAHEAHAHHRARFRCGCGAESGTGMRDAAVLSPRTGHR